jgi:hypothetical protein
VNARPFQGVKDRSGIDIGVTAGALPDSRLHVVAFGMPTTSEFQSCRLSARPGISQVGKDRASVMARSPASSSSTRGGQPYGTSAMASGASPKTTPTRPCTPKAPTPPRCSATRQPTREAPAIQRDCNASFAASTAGHCRECRRPLSTNCDCWHALPRSVITTLTLAPLLVAAPSGTGGTPADVTDGDDKAYILCASNRRSVIEQSLRSGPLKVRRTESSVAFSLSAGECAAKFSSPNQQRLVTKV